MDDGKEDGVADALDESLDAAGLVATEEVCPHCLKPLELCVCETIVAIPNRVEVVVLQHPQEQDKLLGTARVLVRHLAKATFRVGLSWPSLAKAVGRPVDPRRWAILYLGPAEEEASTAEMTVYEGAGRPLADQARAMADLQGLILLDGSWSQAKTLWWRNPWVLKTRRVVIRPKQASLYGKLRKEPRRDGLSTLEAAGFLLARLENKPEIETAMLSTFRRMLQRFRDSRFAVKPKKAPTRPPRKKPAA